MKRLRIAWWLVVFVVCICPISWSAVDHVILISLDGFRSDVITKFRNQLPHFQQLIQEGATTLNARTDPDYTVTIPNHTCMLTGRGAAGELGHGVNINTDTTKSIHEIKESYVKSIFDVVHDHQLSSAMCASKIKFKIYSDSYPIDDVQLTDQDDATTMKSVGKILKGDQVPAFLFVHFSGMDKTGHKYGWKLDSNSKYVQTAFQLDDYLGQIMTAVRALNVRGKSTVLIVTSDHGGRGKNHSANRDPRNYTIPFLVWGAGIAVGKDLYELNEVQRVNPGWSQISYRASQQPIRNGEAANLALRLLGFSCVPQSTIGCAPSLVVEEPAAKNQR